jgi:hypothetical protein
MITPSQLSARPKIAPTRVSEYDFECQRRWETPLIAGTYTSGSIQTFDIHGKPSDNRGDNND